MFNLIFLIRSLSNFPTWLCYIRLSVNYCVFLFLTDSALKGHAKLKHGNLVPQDSFLKMLKIILLVKLLVSIHISRLHQLTFYIILANNKRIVTVIQ